MSYTNCMCQEKKEEEDLPAYKIGLMHWYNDLKTKFLKNLWIWTYKPRLNIDFVSYPTRAEGLVNMIINFIYMYIFNLYILSIIMLMWKKKHHAICKFYKLISGEKEKKKRKAHVLFENNQIAHMSSQKKKHRQNYLSWNIIKCSIQEIELILWN